MAGTALSARNVFGSLAIAGSLRWWVRRSGRSAPIRPTVKGGGKTYHWAEQNCTTGVMPDGHGLAGWAGGLAWSGAGAGLGRALIGGWPVWRWR